MLSTGLGQIPSQEIQYNQLKKILGSHYVHHGIVFQQQKYDASFYALELRWVGFHKIFHMPDAEFFSWAYVNYQPIWILVLKLATYYQRHTDNTMEQNTSSALSSSLSTC